MKGFGCVNAAAGIIASRVNPPCLVVEFADGVSRSEPVLLPDGEGGGEFWVRAARVPMVGPWVQDTDDGIWVPHR